MRKGRVGGPCGRLKLDIFGDDGGAQKRERVCDERLNVETGRDWRNNIRANFGQSVDAADGKGFISLENHKRILPDSDDVLECTRRRLKTSTIQSTRC